MLSSQEHIKNQIYEDWGDKPQSQICLELLDYLLRVAANRLVHITYGSLKQVINKNYTDSDILQAIQYLSCDRTNLLETNFELIENDENIYPLSKTEVSIAQNTGELIHPETGKLVPDFHEKVFMYFKPSSLIKNIIK
ncbi:hypothetical protein [Anabaena sp. AL93]|jgi:hypothetical protein|uniref:hypothetical protein n=1 Tax=Anabaena sp. AL93 TaxID=1678133 RepID=UPI0007FF18CE|nr:hypothetical protein [Anabaena sp. AL93]OBQ21530.1 MAG: hypothetical protein AN486_04390 [Anabaena sp. AL93]